MFTIYMFIEFIYRQSEEPAGNFRAYEIKGGTTICNVRARVYACSLNSTRAEGD